MFFEKFKNLFKEVEREKFKEETIQAFWRSVFKDESRLPWVNDIIPTLRDSDVNIEYEKIKNRTRNFKDGHGDVYYFVVLLYYIYLKRKENSICQKEIDRVCIAFWGYDFDTRCKEVLRSEKNESISTRTIPNLIGVDQISNDEALTGDFVEHGISRSIADFVDPSGSWHINLISEEPKWKDHNFLFLEPAGHNMNSDEHVGVFAYATLKERKHDSGYTIGYKAVRIAVRVHGERQSIIEFNRILRNKQVVGDATAALVGDGPTAVIELEMPTGILNDRYEFQYAAFVLRPNKRKFEVEASLYTLLSEETLRKKDGGALPSRIKSELIKALLSLDIHPEDSEEGRVHLVRQTYLVQHRDSKSDA